MSIAKQVDALARKIETIPERAMHWHLVLRALRAGPIEFAARLVGEVLARPIAPSRRPDVLRMRLLEVLSGAAPVPEDALDYDFRRNLYAAADAVGADSVKRHLRSRIELADPDVLARRLPREIADIPLGRRRSLAKGEDRLLLDQLALDPDAIVLEHLLRNPRMRESDVIRIAALRPVAAETLERIDAEPRWQRSPRIRSAIARNPFCPLDLSLKLIATLGTKVLKDIARDSGLPLPIREAVAFQLAARSGETALAPA